MKIGQYLIEKEIVKEKEIYSSLADKHRLQFIDLRKQKISKQSLTSLPQDMVLDHEVLPLANKDGTLILAAHFVDMVHLTDEFKKASGCNEVKYVLSTPSQIRNIIHLLYSKTPKHTLPAALSSSLEDPQEVVNKQNNTEDKTLKIVSICYRLELIAHQSYFLLSTLSQDEEMRAFWLQMSEEENMHLAFWRRLKKTAEKWPLPDIFDDLYI